MKSTVLRTHRKWVTVWLVGNSYGWGNIFHGQNIEQATDDSVCQRRVQFIPAPDDYNIPSFDATHMHALGHLFVI